MDMPALLEERGDDFMPGVSVPSVGSDGGNGTPRLSSIRGPVARD